MANSLAQVLSEITAAANQPQSDELAQLRALAAAPEIRTGATAVPAVTTTPEERLVPDKLRFSFDFAVNGHVGHTSSTQHAGKAEGGIKAGLLGIGGGISGELCREESQARATDHRARIHIEGTLARQEMSPGARLLRDTALRMAAIQHEAAISQLRRDLLGDPDIDPAVD